MRFALQDGLRQKSRGLRQVDYISPGWNLFLSVELLTPITGRIVDRDGRIAPLDFDALSQQHSYQMRGARRVIARDKKHFAGFRLLRGVDSRLVNIVKR